MAKCKDAAVGKGWKKSEQKHYERHAQEPSSDGLPTVGPNLDDMELLQLRNQQSAPAQLTWLAMHALVACG